MNINLYGSTGVIGKLTLKLLSNYFPNYKINLLCAKSNLKTLVNQCQIYQPNYVYLDNPNKINQLKSNLPKKTRILYKNDLLDYLENSKSDMSILAVSGYQSLKYLEPILKNSKQMGIVSKEAIVSGGHILKKLSKKYQCEIFPLDSEHYSIFSHFNKINLKQSNVKKINLTASGGPFYKKKFKSLTNVSFSQAIKHPKWKMGYKNSIDSATLVNKCLELIEAHYLFDISYHNLDILIHPESLVHSIIEYTNYTSNLIYFYNDMKIPIFNFLNNKENINFYEKKFTFPRNLNISLEIVDHEVYPVFKYFKSIDKTIPQNIIKFNIGNQFAVDLFKEKKIKYVEIIQLIKEITSLKLVSDVNNIDNILNYHDILFEYIKSNY